MSANATDSLSEIPSDREKEVLRKLVLGIVLAQGNVFIKELLRTKEITIGSTKADFESNLLRAIEEGRLRQADVEAWLREVEGWGDQHVYLYHVPERIASDPLWTSLSKIADRLRRAGMEKLWNAQTSLEFPKERRLTGIYFTDDALQFVWHQRQLSWIRASKRDREEDWQGDHYQLRAYRERGDRTIMRFEMRLGLQLAAVFLQIPWNREDHVAALEEVSAAVKPLLTLVPQNRFNVATAIKDLDQAELQTSQSKTIRVTAQRTRLNDATAYVEFGTSSEEGIFKDSEAVRQVRRAVRPARFDGTTGIFFYQPDKEQRKVKIELFGSQRRIRLWAQLTATQVWNILTLLGKYG
jgi:uncharacterized protein YxeA